VVEQSDPYIEKLPKISSGEIMDPEHHNAIVDAINSLAFTAIGLQTNSFVYLALTGKVVYGFTTDVPYNIASGGFLLTRDILVDRSVIAFVCGSTTVGVIGRYTDPHNLYIFSVDWNDQALYKRSKGDWVEFAWLYDDISDYTWISAPFALSISGSTIKGLWWIPKADGTIDPLDVDWLRNNLRDSIVVTDTDIVSGRFGFDTHTFYGIYHNVLNQLSVYLLEPLSSHRPAIAVIETSVVKDENGIRADLLHDYVVPKKHEKLYNKLKSVGFDDSEIERFYRIRKVDRMSFNYGSIDYKGGSTMFLAVYGGDKDVVDKQIEYVRKKNMFVDFVKQDIGYVRDLYKKIRSENRDMLITENELAYQLLGYEELELNSISDFYQREVIDLGRLRRNIDREIDMWINRAKRLNKTDVSEKLRRIKRR